MGIGFDQELRFLARPDEVERRLDAILPWLSADVHDRARPVAWTRTTYLDTPDLRYFRSGERPYVMRLRVRDYGSSVDPRSRPRFGERSWLELKVTHGSRRRKIRWSAPRATVSAALQGDERAQTGCPALLRRHLARPLAPRLITLYRRLAFRGEGASVRLTIDLDLRFTGPGGEPVAASDVAVVEIKLPGDPPPWLAQALPRLGAPRRFSKFHDGMRLLGGTPCALSSCCSSPSAAGPVQPGTLP